MPATIEGVAEVEANVPKQTTIIRQEPSVPSTTTREEDRHSAGQRTVNLIWEFSQAFIALSITCAKIYSALFIVAMTSASLDNAFFLIVGFYFGRTNHQKVGGVQLGR